MKTTIILSVALTALFLAPAIGRASQDGRYERLHERAEFRREMREQTRDRIHARAEVMR